MVKDWSGKAKMKPVFTLPLIFLAASSALAQHGGVAGHAAPAASAPRSFSMASPGPIRSVGSAPAYRPNLASSQYRPNYTSPIGPPPFGGTQPITGRRYPYPVNGRRPYYSSPYYYGSGLYLGYPGYGYGYSDDSSYTDQPQAAAPVYPDAYAQAQMPDAGYDQPQRPPYDPQTQLSSQPSAPPADQPEITLLFKDGRPPQQVQNYAVTRTTLYVLDGPKRREIPLDDIDLPQTEKTNRDAGLDFEIPAGVD